VTIFQTQMLAMFLVGFACGFLFLYVIAHLEALDARRRRAAQDDEPPQKGFGL
jgi:hypothetical protein